MNKYAFILVLTLPLNTAADISTKKQAGEFLDAYCISLVNEIAKSVEKQKSQAAQEDWKGFFETGGWISGVADVYSKLCK